MANDTYEDLGEMVLHQETADAVLLSETEKTKPQWCLLSLCRIEPSDRAGRIVKVEMQQWKAEELGFA